MAVAWVRVFDFAVIYMVLTKLGWQAALTFDVQNKFIELFFIQ